MKQIHEATLNEILQELLPPKLNRHNPRCIKRKMSKWPLSINSSHHIPSVSIVYCIADK
jgi:hypothetical protein